MNAWKMWLVVGTVFLSGLSLVASAGGPGASEGLLTSEQARRCADAAAPGEPCEAVEFAPLVFSAPATR